MGVSTDAYIVFGLPFEEEFQFPWDDEEYGNDVEKWWKDVNGYVNPTFNPYTEDGEYKEGYDRNSPEVDVFFEHSRKWEKENPMPVEMRIHCSYDYPMYIMSINDDKRVAAWRGSPTKLDPNLMSEDKVEDTMKIIEFCQKYEIEYASGPAWYLYSMWG